MEYMEYSRSVKSFSGLDIEQSLWYSTKHRGKTCHWGYRPWESVDTMQFSLQYDVASRAFKEVKRLVKKDPMMIMLDDTSLVWAIVKQVNNETGTVVYELTSRIEDLVESHRSIAMHVHASTNVGKDYWFSYTHTDGRKTHFRQWNGRLALIVDLTPLGDQAYWYLYDTVHGDKEVARGTALIVMAARMLVEQMV